MHTIKKWDPLTSPGTSAQMIIKDLGEIHSRLLDHRPVIQGETRYFVKEFEEKRGFREMRVLENVKSSTSEANEQTLPGCKKAMQDNLNRALQTLKVANQTVCRLQQRQQQERMNEPLQASDERRRAQWEEIMKEQEKWQAAVDEEHKKAMERLREQYTAMEKELAKSASF